MKWFISILIIGSIGFSIWYHIPSYHEQEYSFSSYQGEQKTATILFKVNKHRSYFAPTFLSGEIIYNGVISKSHKVEIGNGFIYKWREKLNGRLAPTVFLNTTQDGKTAIEREQWYLYNGTPNLKQIIMIHETRIENAESIVYVAPATNEEEAMRTVKEVFGFK